MTTNQLTKSQAFTELPVRLYSALRTIRIYPPSNPQVTKTTEKVIAILGQLLEREGTEITLASSEQKILVNGNPLPEKDQQRPQIQGLIELLSTLQIHALTFQNDFTASDCIRFLELLSAAGGNMQPGQPIKELLQEAELNSVSVDEKRYVAVHEGEQVVTEDQIGPGGGLQIDDGDPAGFILGKTSGDGAGLSTAALSQLLASDKNEDTSLSHRQIMHQEQQDKEQQLNQGQIRENIKLLLSGDHTVLGDDQVVQTLPASVQRLLQHNKNEAADKLLIQMVAGLQKKDTEVRRGSAEALGRTAAALVQAEEWQRLDRLLPALKQALPFMEAPQAGRRTLLALEQLTRHHLTHKAYNRAINALNILFDLTMHSQGSNSALYDLAQTCLVNLAEPALLDNLLENIQTGNEKNDNCWYLISRMGAGAANFLMERLGRSESREERELLLRLIGDIGKPARDALLLLLRQESPWYVTRNIIRLLKNVGDADCFTTIAPFLGHEELRVQQEVIQTLGVIGGTARKKFFLQELESASDDLKPLVIRQLGKIHNESIVLPLTDLLQSSAGPPHQAKEQLQIEICVALVRLGSKQSLASLKKVVQTKKIPGIEDYSPKVLAAAESALQAIRAGSKVLTDPIQQPEPTSHTHLTRKNDPLAEKEASIFRRAARGKVEEAKQELYNLIISCAEKKDFANAERLRERIYEIDPMALSEIIRSGEIIEKEKTGAVSRNRLDTWSRLLKKLNNVEFSAIYHELQERTFAPEEIIVRQGDKNDELYFINQGSIKTSYNKDGRDIFVSSMNSGQIIGENFFDASFWTVTLTALTSVNISVLKWDSFRRWQDEYPGLEAKLQSFYKQCDTTRQLLEKKGLDRRRYERTRLSRKIQLQLTDHNNKPIGRGFRGELADISEGGLAFLIRISKKENTRLLLGRNMRITIPVGGEPGHLQLYGLAIGIQPYELLESDFSVHIKFPELLDEKTLFQVLG